MKFKEKRIYVVEWSQFVNIHLTHFLSLLFSFAENAAECPSCDDENHENNWNCDRPSTFWRGWVRAVHCKRSTNNVLALRKSSARFFWTEPHKSWCELCSEWEYFQSFSKCFEGIGTLHLLLESTHVLNHSKIGVEWFSKVNEATWLTNACVVGAESPVIVTISSIETSISCIVVNGTQYILVGILDLSRSWYNKLF